jgi:hypothetical protein
MTRVPPSEGVLESSVDVPSTGFHWESRQEATTGRPGRFLVQNGEPGERLEFRRRFPLGPRPAKGPDRVVLFRRFMATRPTEEGILEFAGDWGLLGVPSGMLQPGEPPGLPIHLGPFGETLEAWQGEIQALKAAFEVWEACGVDKPDLDLLRDRIHWSGKDRVYYSTFPAAGLAAPPAELAGKEFALIASREPDFRAWVFELPGMKGRDSEAPARLETPARLWVQDAANKRLKDHTAARLLYDRDMGRSVLRVVPIDLMGALWLQVGWAVAGKATYRECARPRCGVWFEIHPERGERTSRRFCSETCRVALYREKKKAEGGDAHA